MTEQRKTSENYSVVVPADLAEDIEEYREVRGLNKSKAGLELMKAGLREKRRTSHFVARIVERMIWIGMAAVVTLVASFLWLVAFGGTAFAVGINPWYVLNAAAIVVIVTAIGWFFRVSGAAEWCDARLGELDERLGFETEN